ncbi:MAG: hypothetical protein JWP02_2092 [Acidimicrobiales bacterium]|nr:hypothetical protein [Acidimicrobiales bacterium]
MPLPAIRRSAVAGAVALGSLVAVAAPAFGADASPARGAPTSDLIPATIVAAIAVALVAVGVVFQRRDRFPLLRRLGAFSERVSGMPPWAALPQSVAGVSLFIAVFGFYWDVSWHIDRGRDPGPLANPAHWFIIVGLAGIALAGVLSIALGDERVTRTSVRVGREWNVPVGGLLLSICGIIALAGFPLDDVWHRLFGQDVTLWGPTHIQMIGGASLATLAMWVLAVEGQRAAAASGKPMPARGIRAIDLALGGAFLIGLSTLQGEFDFGVPQFNQLYQPVLIMLAAGIGLVAVRVRVGKGGALGAVLFFLAVRGGLALLIGPALGRTLLHFPLYVVEALVVEAVALRVPARRRPLTLGLWAGLGIGTIGLAAEWAWSQVFMPLPWRASLWPSAFVYGVVAAVAGGLVGGLIGRSLAPVEAGERAQRLPRGAAVAVGAAILLVLGLPLTASAHHYRADLSLDPPFGLPGGNVHVTVRMHPANAARDARWFNVTSWQGQRKGDGGLRISDLHEVSPGVYQTNGTVPVFGEWKTLLRLHTGRSLQVVPIYMPADPAIPAKMVTPWPKVTRTFQHEKSVLQREAVGSSQGLQRPAYAVLAVLALVWIGSLAWGLRRLEEGPVAPGVQRGEQRPAPEAASERQSVSATN